MWIVIVAIAVIICMVYWAVVIALYENSAYCNATKTPYPAMRFDLGKFGEYLTYKKLQPFEKRGAKFLFTCYLPYEDKTTEIDVIMIYKSGVYVFESKNYSGWIFGDEKNKTWTQSLPQGKGTKKEHFFNPVWQNMLHVKCLKNVIGEKFPVHSIIVFSERCTLKKIAVESDIAVVKRDSILQVTADINNKHREILTTADIEKIYTTLYPYTQVSDELKEKHVENIK